MHLRSRNISHTDVLCQGCGQAAPDNAMSSQSVQMRISLSSLVESPRQLYGFLAGAALAIIMIIIIIMIIMIIIITME